MFIVVPKHKNEPYLSFHW